MRTVAYEVGTIYCCMGVGGSQQLSKGVLLTDKIFIFLDVNRNLMIRIKYE